MQEAYESSFQITNKYFLNFGLQLNIQITRIPPPLPVFHGFVQLFQDESSNKIPTLPGTISSNNPMLISIRIVVVNQDSGS